MCLSLCLSLSGCSQLVSRRLVVATTTFPYLTSTISNHENQNQKNLNPQNTALLSKSATPTTILSNPHSPKTPTHSHDTVSETPLSLSLSLSVSLSRSPTPASIHSRVTQPQGQPSASSFSLLLFSHSRTALLVHSVSGADKTLKQLASNHGVRVGH